MEKRLISVRVPTSLYTRVQNILTQKAPYNPTITQVVERGLELACKELEKKQ